MVEVIKRSKNGKFSVRFCHRAIPGHTVSLAGVFNDWDPARNEMIYTAADNAYTCTVDLPAGQYEYKLVINGEWVLDDDNPNFVSNDFGTLNSVIVVK